LPLLRTRAWIASSAFPAKKNLDVVEKPEKIVDSADPDQT